MLVCLLMYIHTCICVYVYVCLSGYRKLPETHKTDLLYCFHNQLSYEYILLDSKYFYLKTR